MLLLSINGKTKLTGLIGYPIEHTKSPHMHNKAYEFLGLNYSYVPLGVTSENLRSAIDGIKALGFSGVNVTIPYKETVIPFLDELSKEASLIGAVNTIKNENGKLIGYNTDGQGFVSDVEEHFSFDFKGKVVLLLGAGGAARSIAVSMLMKGIQSLMIVDAEDAKASALVRHLKKHFMAKISYSLVESKEMYNFLKTIDLFVNATPIGMHPHTDVVPLKKVEDIGKNVKIYDIIYNPAKTKLVEIMEKRGNQCANGLGMLAGQGAVAFKVFTGKSIQTGKMIEFLSNE
ncbi:MAG: shikimate dehydrogenase [Candidatus Margulisbacteria bacterium GWF2_38_17]|nr:MAG: shikimate dehydrogenase [Candidatus Margulisbacteria bacterium GWF2_38_17]